MTSWRSFLRSRPWAWHLPAVVGAAAVLILAGQLGRWAADFDGWTCRSGDYHAAEGEALIHGLADSRVALSMPGSSVPSALLCGHAAFPARIATRGLGLLACAALLFALGSLLHSPACGALAALWFALCPVPDLSSDRWLYTLHLLLVACVMVWRSRAPSAARSAALGATIGMSLFVLSPLFLFPLVLLLEVWRQKRGGRLAQASWIILMPLLVLAPWILMNWRLQHGLVLFEDGRARANIITGALGFVSTGRTTWNVVLHGRAVGDNAAVWALREILGHPSDYLRACGSRLVLAVSFHPVLWACALCATWLGRRFAAVRQSCLLILYFLLVHCLMPVEARYFEPLLPLLMAMGCWTALSWSEPGAQTAGGRLAAGMTAAVAALLLCVQLYAQGLVMAYPGRAAEAAALDRELQRRPEESWLWSARGSARLKEGRPQEAASDLGKALAREPGRPQWRQPYVWARCLSGGPAGLWPRLPPAQADPPAALRGYAFRALYHLEHRRPAEARAALELMRDLRSGLPAFGREADMRLLQGRPADWSRFDSELLEETAAFWPEARRPGLLKQARVLLSAKPAEPARLAELWLEEASLTRRAGLREEALAALERPSSASLTAEQRLRAAGLLRDLGEFWRADQVLRAAGPPTSSERDLLIAIARAAHDRGQGALALHILDSCDKKSLDEGQARVAAELYRRWGRPQDAVETLRWVRESRPHDAGLLLDLASAATEAGQRRAALEALDSLVLLGLDAPRGCRAARLYSDLRAAAPAAAALRRAMSKGRCDAALVLDVAATARDAGLRAQALETLALSRALLLDAELVRAAARLYSELGEPQLARATMQRLSEPRFRELRVQDLRDIRLVLDLAEAAAGSRDHERARQCLARARDLAPDEEALGRMAVLQQMLGEYRGALDLLDRLVREHLGRARWRNDRGVLRLLMGDREAGIRDLQDSISRDPKFLSPYLSLGGLYASSGRREEALKLYEQALSQTIPVGALPARELLDRIRSEREHLLAAPGR